MRTAIDALEGHSIVHGLQKCRAVVMYKQLTRGMVIFFGNRTAYAGDVAETEISVMVFDVYVSVATFFWFSTEATVAAFDPVEPGKHE